MRDHIGRAQRYLPLVGCCLAAAAGCAQQNQYQEPPPPPVTVAQPVQKTVTLYFEETGTTEAVQQVAVRARVKGFLEKVNFEAGQDVEEGDVLYLIEKRQYQAAVDAAQADVEAKLVELEKSEVEYKRQENLLKEDATAERNLVLAKAERDGAKAAVAAAKADLDRVQLDLEYTEVKAPIAGRVGKTLVKAGNLVDGVESTQLTTVIDYDPIYANFNVSERALLAARKKREEAATEKPDAEDPRVYLQRANDDGFPYEGTFDYADLAVDQSTGTFMVRAVFPNPDDEIIPGLFVRIRLPMETRENALLVPERAVRADQDGKYVLVVYRGDDAERQNEVERRNVSVGQKQGGLVIIEEGLMADDLVIIEGVQRARPGTEVDPTDVSATDEKPEEVESPDGESEGERGE